MENSRKIEPKQIPSHLIPRLLVVFTRQLKILVTTLDTSIDTSLDKFQDMLFRAIDHHIPQRTLKRRSRPPWIDNEIMKLIRKKKKLWKRLKTNGSADLFLKKENLKHFWAFYSIKSKTK